MNLLQSKLKAVAIAFWLMAVGLAVCPAQAATSGAKSSPANVLTTVKSWSQMSPVEKSQFVCALAAVLVLFIAEIGFIVAGFKTSVGWGLFMLFIGGMRSIFAAVVLIGWIVRWMVLARQHELWQLPMLLTAAFVIFAGSGAIFFVVRHWRHARRPLALMGLGLCLLAVVAGLEYAK